MKVAISATGRGINDEVSGIFGRCPYFIIAEIQENKITKTETIENTSRDQVGGAGISAAQLVVERGVNAIITGNIGPRATEVFNQFKIVIYKAQGTIKEALQKLIEEKLEKIER